VTPLRRMLTASAKRTAAKKERARVLRAFEELAGSYSRNAAFHARHMPQVAEVEQAHADDLRRIITVWGGCRP
jgi:hypothetical protein